MELEITPERQAYFDARGKIILNACPGSGKTTCIVHKIRLLEKECIKNFGSYAGIACLSFTNVAKNEILRKYKKAYGEDLKYPHLVSTIDSFFNQHITLPFYNLLNNSFKRPKIVDQSSVIDNSFKVRYKQNGVWKVGIQSPLFNYKNRAGRPLHHSYPPSTIWIDANENFTFNGNSPDPSNVDPKVFQEYGKKIFELRAKKGLITSLDAAFISLYILKKHKQIGQWLVKRFPYIIVDEAQDNSEMQHLIFEMLESLGLQNIEMVGDPYQSLYEWRDARPQLFLQKYKDPNWKGLPLSQNRRSVQRIIDCFSIIRNAGDEPITSVSVADLNIPIFVYKYTATNPATIVQHFEENCIINNFKENHIVVRGNALRDRMLGKTADVNPWKTVYPERLLQIRHHFESNEIRDAVNDTRKLVIELLNPDLDYSALQDLQNSMKEDYSFNGKLYAFLFNVPPTTLSFEEWTTASIDSLKQTFGVDTTALFEFKVKINGYKMKELKKQNVNLYFNKPATNKYNIPITTIHQVKGATLDSILYFFNESSVGESVSFQDFKPSPQFPSEKQRMIYVACSRPKQFLAMAFPEKITDAELKAKFGENITIMTV